MKNNIKNHLYYYWYVYVVIVAVTIVLTSWITNNIIRTRPYEKVQLFVGAVKIDKVKMVDSIMKDADETLRESNILSFPLEDDYFNTYLTSAGITETDYIIIPEKYATKDFVSEYCLSLTPYKNKLNEIYDFSYYNFDTSFDMGIVVYDKENNYSLLDKFITYNINESNYNKYYLFINKDSVNISYLRSVNASDSNHAYEGLKKLINYEE